MAALPLTQEPAPAKSDWIEGDQDEIKLPAPRVQELREQNRGQWRQGNPDGDDSDTNTAQPMSVQRGYQPSSSQAQDQAMSRYKKPSFDEDVLDASGHPLNLDDLDKRPVSAPKLTITPGGSNVITGGVSSANFRTANTLNRGTDALAASLMNTSPYLGTPRTVAVQPGTFKAFLDRNHSGEVAGFGKTTVVEIKGRWDDCGHIIHNFGMPFTRIAPTALPKADLSKTKIMVVNCGAEFDGPSLSTIHDFVAHGGFLMTTDWALDSCLQKAFPGYVAWNGGYTDNSVVDAVVVDRDPDLTRGIPKVGYWKLEDKSQTVQVIRKMEVQVLVRSRLLMQREPSQLGILALTFPYGDGQILHIVGHFDNNADRASNSALPDPAPIIGIGLRQAIAANFIMAAARDAGPQNQPVADGPQDNN